MSAGQILNSFYAAVVKRNLAEARGYLSDDLLFKGLFETYHGADAYIASLSGLLSVTVRLDVKKIISEESDAAVFFELQTKAPAEGTVLVAKWHQVKNGKIWHVESAFDGRPYEAMFAGGSYVWDRNWAVDDTMQVQSYTFFPLVARSWIQPSFG